MGVIVKLIPPAGYVVTLVEAKSHLRITDTVHDTRLTAYISAATAQVESITEMLLYEQTIRLDLDGFPDGDIDIPVYPIQSVISVKYDDGENAETILVENTDYFVRVAGRYPKISPKGEWPTAYEGKPGSVRIVMLAGFESSASSPEIYGQYIPEDLKHAILVKIKEFFDYGGETILGQEVNPSANPVSLLTQPYKRYWIA